jgi:hypothetical protein
MYVGQDTDQLTDANFVSSNEFEGAQVSYPWRHLEHSEGEYDFSDIESDLATLKSAGKKLFLNIKDTGSAPEKCVPGYILKDPKYGGGVEYQVDDGGKKTGVVARRWDPEVQKRFKALLMALGKQFDGRVSGVRLSETAIDIKTHGPGVPKGFSPDIYVDAVKTNMLALKQAFPNTLVIQHANFMPEDTPDDSRLRQIYQYGIQIGVGLGESDLMLDMNALKNGEIKGNKHHHAYQIMQEGGIKGRALIVIAAEDGNYLGKTGTDDKPTGPWPDIVPSMFDFAKNGLNAQYIFWQHQEPFFTHDVIPFVRAGNQ